MVLVCCVMLMQQRHDDDDYDLIEIARHLLRCSLARTSRPNPHTPPETPMDIANDDDHVEDLDHAEDDADDDDDDHDEDGEQPRQFTVEDIVAKAEEFAVSCNYDMADLFYRKALECVPDTVPIMEDYSNLLLEMQEVDRALTVRLVLSRDISSNEISIVRSLVEQWCGAYVWVVE